MKNDKELAVKRDLNRRNSLMKTNEGLTEGWRGCRRGEQRRKKVTQHNQKRYRWHTVEQVRLIKPFHEGHGFLPALYMYPNEYFSRRLQTQVPQRQREPQLLESMTCYYVASADSELIGLLKLPVSKWHDVCCVSGWPLIPLSPNVYNYNIHLCKVQKRI